MRRVRGMGTEPRSGDAADATIGDVRTEQTGDDAHSVPDCESKIWPDAW